MAAYKSDFDPPNRPMESTRGRRLGTYIAVSKMEQKTNPQMLDRSTRRTTPTPSNDQTRATALPQNSTSKQEVKEKGPVSGFSFGKPSSKISTTEAAELKGKPSRNVLRRKQSSISQSQQDNEVRPDIERSTSATPGKQIYGSSQRRPSLETSRSTDAYNEIYTRPSRTRTPIAKESPRIIPELDRYRARPEQATFSKVRSNAEIPHKLSTQDLPPPTPLLSGTPGYSGMSSTNSRYSGSGYSASPSTRFSESPGIGTYSRDTTPTSMSSSPGIVAPMKLIPPRLRQGSPAVNSRPPLTGRRDGSFPQEHEEPVVETLPTLRESTNSSSSNSTVKGDSKGIEKKKKRMPTLPPSPPPRKSSHKASESPRGTPTKSAQPPAKPILTAFSESSSFARRTPVTSPSKQNPPARPSREGAPDLQTQLGESMTVIQSNLAGIPSPQERRRSLLQRHVTSPLQTQPVMRPSQGSRLPSRNPSPSPVLTSPREATPAPTGLGIVPDLRPREQPSTRGTRTRTPSPSIPTSKPRFGLFTRRTRTTPEITTSEVRNKEPRKGPAAGTGHEGYGRYALRGRSSSTGVGMVARDRSQSRTGSSRDSVGSNHATDPFLLQRMSPVIIAGGGEIKENQNESSELSRSESNTSLLLGRPSLDSRGSSKSSLGQEAARATLWPSALSKEQPVKRNTQLAMSKGRRPSDSSDDAVTKPSLAFRRSLLRLNVSENALNLPRPLKIPSRGVSPAMTSLDPSIMSDDSRIESKPVLIRGRKEEKKDAKKPKKLEKRAKSPRKWNFFHRSQPSNSKSKGEESVVPVAVEIPSAKKPAAVPHYALIDSDEQQEVDAVDLEDILRDAANVVKDADVFNISNEELEAVQFDNYKDNLRRIEDLQSILGVSPPPPEKVEEVEKAEEIAPPPMHSSPEPMQTTPELAQSEFQPSSDITPPALGRPSRLAQVGRIPKVISARPQATSPKSFSRPFARLSTNQPVPKPEVLDVQSIAVGPSPTPSTSEMQSGADRKSNSQSGSYHHNSGDSTVETDQNNDQDFIRFSPERKDSGTTTISSSGMSFAGTTAVVPEVGAELEEDEIWDEFDDLIENDRPVSTTSSCGVPFQYESYESRRMRRSRMQAKGSSTLTTQPPSHNPPKDITRRSEYTTSSVYSVEVGTAIPTAPVDTSPTPTSAMSFGDFISGYGDRNNSVSEDSSRASQSSSRRSIASSNSIKRISDDSNSPISQVNLRIGSMTVSKWLTFGHVLFSPAREEIMQNEGSKRHSILVIDGLGNDDWSFYAAETYPSCTFYNLSPSSPSTHRSSSSSFPSTPPNHRQIQYPVSNPTTKYPFPSQYFHVVVLRFPAAMPESSYRNLISESKRVLKPGGYLETAILDLDMLNMGNRARRAVRGLKVQMQINNPAINLSSASDTVLRLIGKKGFVDVKSCNVGVPVASTIPGTKRESRGKRKEMSLQDMMRDESQVGDEGITKMVAKVGRWWWGRCYEVEGKEWKGVFGDEALLEECEKWGSSFKLVVAHAQKPDGVRRRGASV
ncbi:hypothetical protein HYALB_00009173 [Hymenoscyphus albidus]|uniref:Methyltransferase type 11 domain-containing protein n=1 Tax=Hymenoscyphus albidus TaxID=595503 RepID=A0A9N9QBX6_9HELO|nr:hypothetical protein HYALB_00009173 [Hymenoscyphus albidus]